MRLDIYVNYRGTCEQAFRYYEKHLGGRITGLVRHREQPNPGVAADWQEKILHARIEIGTTVLMGADVPHAAGEVTKHSFRLVRRYRGPGLGHRSRLRRHEDLRSDAPGAP